MIDFSVRKTLTVLALAATAGLGLSACATPAPAPEPTNSDAPIGGDIVAPIELNYQDIDGQTIGIVVGQTININYGGINDGEVDVVVADESVATYTDPKFEDGVQFSAAITGKSGGETPVTFTFTGEEPKELTVQVLLQ